MNTDTIKGVSTNIIQVVQCILIDNGTGYDFPGLELNYYSTVRYNMTQYYQVYCIQYNATQHNTIQHSTIQHNTAQYYTIQYDMT